MTPMTELKPGQTFKTSEGLVWELDKLLELSTAIPHVKMVGLKDRSESKIIAASVLRDQRLYQAV